MSPIEGRGREAIKFKSNLSGLFDDFLMNGRMGKLLSQDQLHHHYKLQMEIHRAINFTFFSPQVYEWIFPLSIYGNSMVMCIMHFRKILLRWKGLKRIRANKGNVQERSALKYSYKYMAVKKGGPLSNKVMMILNGEHKKLSKYQENDLPCPAFSYEIILI